MAYKRGGYYYATAYDHGRRVYIKAGPSKKVAEQIERDLKTKIVKGEYLGIYDEKRVLLRDFIPRYLAYSQANKRPESASRDERSLKALAASFGGSLPVGDHRRDDRGPQGTASPVCQACDRQQGARHAEAPVHAGDEVEVCEPEPR